jgi:hypothetical protein
MISKWYQLLKALDWPFFESFGQQRMVGVGQAPLRLPGFIPSQLRIVEQNPH